MAKIAARGQAKCVTSASKAKYSTADSNMAEKFNWFCTAMTRPFWSFGGRDWMNACSGMANSPADMPISAEQARGYAQQYLDNSLPVTTIADETDAFYGYYTLHVLRDGQIVGMLSVNGVTGQVWYHTWHGDFIGMTDGDKG